MRDLCSFCLNGGGCSDGEEPNGGLVQAANGYLYGTTFFDGAIDGAQGTVFKITLRWPLEDVQVTARAAAKAGWQATSRDLYGKNYGGAKNCGRLLNYSR